MHLISRCVTLKSLRHQLLFYCKKKGVFSIEFKPIKEVEPVLFHVHVILIFVEKIVFPTSTFGHWIVLSSVGLLFGLRSCCFIALFSPLQIQWKGVEKAIHASLLNLSSLFSCRELKKCYHIERIKAIGEACYRRLCSLPVFFGY